MKYLVLLSLLLILVVACSDVSVKEVCEQNGGKFLGPYNECENIDAEVCEQLGGSYNMCASACRHSQADVCMAVCVKVCKLPALK